MYLTRPAWLIRRHGRRPVALRRRYPWLDRLARAGKRYVDHHGYHYAASITYFSVLSLVPMLMVALAAVGFVLAGQPTLLGAARRLLTAAVPGPLSGVTNGLFDNVVDHRVKIGVFGLAVGLYSGWNWMNALRDSLTAMWCQERSPQRLLPTVAKDLLALLGLAAALLVSFTLTAAGGALGSLLLRLAGLSDAGWANALLVAGSVVLAVAANWLVFLWVLAKLPREPVDTRGAVRAALAAAIGFEILKRLGSVYLGLVGRSPVGVAFGGIVGLLVFIYVVSRMLMLVTAWTVEAARDAPGA
ncbi:MAG TPA: YhjD/YihY/BrkB family envelope integrity protein [Pseudonocardiaceae bacterium]